jgi:predicted metal-dependent hydrolase
MDEQDLIDRDRTLFPVNRATSPEEHALIVRDERFCRSNRPSRWWMNGDPVATAWYNSVSASLPRGEAFFIETTKHFRDLVPAELGEAIKAFVRQEINHTREHVAFNRFAEDHGYDVASIDKGITEMLALAEGRPKELNLAVSLALEHFAASISHELLSDPRYLAGADPEAAELWRWHATEEIEHKGLVYDIWLHATRDWSAWKRWRVRALLALLITRKYFGNRIRDALGLLAQDGITGRRARLRLYAFLWARPGMMRRMFFHWARILLPGFHPWKTDNAHLIRQYRGQAGTGPMPAE